VRSASSLIQVIVALTLSSACHVDAAVVCPPFESLCIPSGHPPAPSFHPPAPSFHPPAPSSRPPVQQPAQPQHRSQDNDTSPSRDTGLNSLPDQAAKLSSDQARANFYYRLFLRYRSYPETARSLKSNWAYFQARADWQDHKYAAALRWYRAAIRLAGGNSPTTVGGLWQRELEPLEAWYNQSQETREQCERAAIAQRETAKARAKAAYKADIADCDRRPTEEERQRCLAAANAVLNGRLQAIAKQYETDIQKCAEL
jgi:hypothetical protein